jgi:hypothetical protein
MKLPFTDWLQQLIAYLVRSLIFPQVVRKLRRYFVRCLLALAPVLSRAAREFWHRLLLNGAELHRRHAQYALMSRCAKQRLLSWCAIVGSYVPTYACCVIFSAIAVLEGLLKPGLNPAQRLAGILMPALLLPIAEFWRKEARWERDWARQLPADPQP